MHDQGQFFDWEACPGPIPWLGFIRRINSMIGMHAHGQILDLGVFPLPTPWLGCFPLANYLIGMHAQGQLLDWNVCPRKTHWFGNMSTANSSIRMHAQGISLIWMHAMGPTISFGCMTRPTPWLPCLPVHSCLSLLIVSLSINLQYRYEVAARAAAPFLTPSPSVHYCLNVISEEAAVITVISWLMFVFSVILVN